MVLFHNIIPLYCNMSPKIITIEGNIGSGKSTLLAHLKQHFQHDSSVVFLKEPVDEWESIRDTNGVTMLQKFYQDQSKYAFPFQMMAYISRLAILKDVCEKKPDAIIITERSLYTDKYVFAKMLYESGLIEDVNYQIYQRWFDTFAAEFPIYGTIYVKTDPTICDVRIHTRSRAGENNIPLDYLVNCSKYHDQMIKLMDNAKPTLLLDGNVDIYHSPDILETWLYRIELYIRIETSIINDTDLP